MSNQSKWFFLQVPPKKKIYFTFYKWIRALSNVKKKKSWLDISLTPKNRDFSTFHPLDGQMWRNLRLDNPNGENHYPSLIVIFCNIRV